MERKTFINQILRYSLFGGLVFLVGFLVSRRKVTLPESCTPGSLCGSCSELSGCSRAEAINQRNHG